MNSKNLAEHFVTSFCQGSIVELESALADDFHLRGPLFEFHSRAEYIDSLRDNLEPDSEAAVLSVLADGEEAAAFYSYKGNIIGQLFRCAEGRIKSTIIVFDARD